VRSLTLLLLVVACQNNDEHPPLLPDTDSGTPVSPGGGPTGNDGASDVAEGGTVTTTASNPRGIFVSNGLVYYTNFASGAGDGTVSVAPASGGAHTDLATALTAPWAITVAAGTVYFTLAPVGTGGVSSVPATGGSVTSIQTGLSSALGIAADGTNVYWSFDSGGPVVSFVPLAGGTPKQLLAFGGALVPTGLLITGTDVYVPTDGSQAAVLAGTTGGSPLTALDAQTPITFADVVVSSTTVYATVDDVAPAGAIVSFPRAGGPAKTVVGNLNHPQRLALDGTHLYFTDPEGGNVWVVDVSQTTPAATLLASGLILPLPIAVADALYVGAADSIVRIPKL
jgi:hypothetical protein